MGSHSETTCKNLELGYPPTGIYRTTDTIDSMTNQTNTRPDLTREHNISIINNQSLRHDMVLVSSGRNTVAPDYARVKKHQLFRALQALFGY